MKKIFFLFFFLTSILLSSHTFAVDYLKSSIYLTSVSGIDLFNNYYDRKNTFALSASEIESLDSTDIPFFDQVAVKPINKKWKDWSDYAVYLTIGSSLYFTYDEYDFKNNIIVFSEVLITQSMVGKWTKSFTRRKRPFVYDDEVDIETKQQRNSQHSFYSLHSSTAFSAATYAYFYYTKNHGKNLPLALFLYGCAGVTGGLRVAAANHYPSDIVVGAIMGTAISYFICNYHYNLKRKKK